MPYLTDFSPSLWHVWCVAVTMETPDQYCVIVNKWTISEKVRFWNHGAIWLISRCKFLFFVYWNKKLMNDIINSLWGFSIAGIDFGPETISKFWFSWTLKGVSWNLQLANKCTCLDKNQCKTKNVGTREVTGLDQTMSFIRIGHSFSIFPHVAMAMGPKFLIWIFFLKRINNSKSGYLSVTCQS